MYIYMMMDEVVFNGTDFPFYRISMVDMRGDKVEVDIFGFHEMDEGSGRFVVYFLQFWLESSLT